MTLVRSFFSKKRRVMCGSTRKLSSMVYGWYLLCTVYCWVFVRCLDVGSSMFYHYHAKRRHMQWGASVAHMRFA